jgi:hypothetical protein
MCEDDGIFTSRVVYGRLVTCKGYEFKQLVEEIAKQRLDIRSALTRRNDSPLMSVPNADHGHSILRSLTNDNDVKLCSAIEGGDTVISEEVLAKANEMYQAGLHEQELVNLFTPALMEVLKEVNPDLRLVNCEQHVWIEISSEAHEACLKPDLFSAYFPMIEYCPPFESAPACSVPRSFGRFKSWRSRSSVHSVWNAEWKINLDALGAKCKYIEIVAGNCVNKDGFSVRMKGVLFDIDMFWMIKSVGMQILSIDKCYWSTPGSKELLIEFLRVHDHWMDATVALCNDLNVTIKDYSTSAVTEQRCALLGEGTYGRAFLLENGEVLKVVMAKNSDFVHAEYTAMTELLKRPTVADVIFPVVFNSYRHGLGATFEYAGYKLAREGRRIELPVSPEMKLRLAKLLWTLHSNQCTHGDSRVQNVLELDGSLKWIDFRCATMMELRDGNVRVDVEMLYMSIHSGIGVLPMKEIHAYVTSRRLIDLETVMLM